MNEHSTPVSDDWLDAALRADAQEHAAHYIADAGFTAKLIGRLPTAAATVPQWRRPVVALLWLALGTAAAVALPGWLDEVFRRIVDLMAGHPPTVTTVAAAITLVGALSWSAIVYAARAD